MLSKIVGSVVGTKNDRELKRMRKVVSKINAREAEIQALSDEQLQQKTEEFKATTSKRRKLRCTIARGVCRLPRGLIACQRHAPLRRAADRWYHLARRQNR